MRDLYDIFLVVAGVVFAIVVGLITWTLIRYRERPGDDLPKQFHSNIRLELLWFAIPQIVVIALFVLSVTALRDVDEPSASPGVTVRVQGFRWGWRFTYEGRQVSVVSEPRTPAELVLPVGTLVELQLTSEDVVHSFYVPRLLVKRDTVPGKLNKLYVTLREAGAYRGVCAEFCGLLHEDMNFTLRAVDDEEFESWLDERAAS